MIQLAALHRRFTIATSGLVAMSAMYLVAFRSGTVAPRPIVMAVLVCVAALGALLTLLSGVATRSHTSILISAGLILILGGGLANWLLSLQGVVILNELEAVPLNRGSHLQQLETGPLSNVAEMNLTMQLEDVELRPAAQKFVPVSRIRLIENQEPPRTLELSQGKAGSLRTLRFHQGAFGFAPRIVITKNGETVFDRYVPFESRPGAARELSFESNFSIAAEKLTVRGAIDLGTLDEKMRGHERLGLTVAREGRPLGAGELTMGHFARLSDGYAIGFAGLRKWSEIDISRRNYPEPMLAGAALMVAGFLVWPFTRRRA